MANRKVRATALFYTSQGAPLAPGEEISLPEPEAVRLVSSGVAVNVAVKPKIKKENGDADSRK